MCFGLLDLSRERGGTQDLCDICFFFNSKIVGKMGGNVVGGEC